MPEMAEHWVMWVTPVLAWIEVGAQITMVASILWAFFKWRRPARRWCLWLALGSFLVSVAVIAFDQWLVFYVWLPTVDANRASLVAERASRSSQTQVDQAAPDFAVTTTEGQRFRLKDLEGRVVLVNFFATWCVPCRKELPHLQSMWEEFGGEGDFRMIVVGREETLETVKKFKEEQRFGFPMAPDAEASVFKLYATDSIPRTYLLDRSGVIVFQSVGYHEAEMPKLKALIKGELKRGR
jgi:peroxiredoxin